jgi:hypothetical protein
MVWRYIRTKLHINIETGSRKQELGGIGQKSGKAEGPAPAPCVHNAYPYAWKRRGDNIKLPEMFGMDEKMQNSMGC